MKTCNPPRGSCLLAVIAILFLDDFTSFICCMVLLDALPLVGIFFQKYFNLVKESYNQPKEGLWLKKQLKVQRKNL